MSQLDRKQRLQMLRRAGGAEPAPTVATFVPRPTSPKRRPLMMAASGGRYDGPHRALPNPCFTTLRR